MENNDPVATQQIERGLALLRQKQRKIRLFALMMLTLCVISLACLFIQQDVVYGLFELNRQVVQLHVPYNLDTSFKNAVDQPDYLLNLLSWFGWLMLKGVTAFIGAFVMVGFLRKFRFFLIRFQSFVLKSVAWLIAFILIWSGLAYIQHGSGRSEQTYAELIQYEQDIRQSRIYAYLQHSDSAEPVQAYLLAQTALLHQPVDKNAALAYTSELIQAERADPHFLEYGFRPEQLWSMQQQLYGKAVTPVTEVLTHRAYRAAQWSEMVKWIILMIMAGTLLMALVGYLLSAKLDKRVLRIAQMSSKADALQ